jgi:hypothetical protein
VLRCLDGMVTCWVHILGCHGLHLLYTEKLLGCFWRHLACVHGELTMFWGLLICLWSMLRCREHVTMFSATIIMSSETYSWCLLAWFLTRIVWHETFTMSREYSPSMLPHVNKSRVHITMCWWTLNMFNETINMPRETCIMQILFNMSLETITMSRYKLHNI